MQIIWHSLYYYGLAAIIGGLFHAVGTFSTERTDPDPQMESVRWFWVVFFAVFAIAASIFYISSFASSVYPNVPEQFGGGKPRSVQLLVDREALRGLKALGFKFCNDDQLSDTVAVLFEGENSFVVRQKGVPVVQIDRSAIRAVSVTPEGCHGTGADKNGSQRSP